MGTLECRVAFWMRHFVSTTLLTLLSLTAMLTAGGCGKDEPLRVGSISSGLGVRTDYAPITSLPSVTLPGAGGSYTDPVFGTKIIRVTDVIDNGSPATINSSYNGYCNNSYSLWSAFNMNDTKLLIICNNYRLLYDFNTTTDTPTFNSALEAGTTIQADPNAPWSPSNANILYAVGRSSGANPKHILYQIDVSLTGSSRFTVLHDFSTDLNSRYGFSWELDELSMSDDENIFIMTVRHNGGGHNTSDDIVMYKKSTNTTTVWQKPSTASDGTGYIPFEGFIDKSGSYVTIEPQNPSGDYQNVWAIWNVGQNSTDLLQNNGSDLPGGHFDNGSDKMFNDDVWYIPGLLSRTLGSGEHTSTQIFTSYTDNSHSTYQWTADHVSARVKGDAWIVMSSYWMLDYTKALENEIWLVNSDGSAFNRIANTRSTVASCNDGNADCYEHQVWAAPSYDGKYVVFHSDMGSGGSGYLGKTDVFIVKVPSNLVPGSGCSTGLSSCSGECVNETNDPNHCGSCTTVCPPTATCVSSACACPTGQTLCTNVNACINTSNDPAHCGSCTNACTAGQACVSGACTTPTSRNLTGTDVTGDGKGDFLTRDSSGNFQVWTSSGTTESDTTNYTSYYNDTAGWNTDSHFFAMDLNGDGKTDLLARSYNGAFDVNKSNGTRPTLDHAFNTTLSDANGWNAGNRIFPADVNGDGKWDLLARQTDGTWQVWLSNGTALTSSGTFTSIYTDTGSWGTGNRFYMLDINGDGKTDFVARAANGTFDVNISNGSTYSKTTTFTSSYTDAAGYNTGNYFFVADVNGDHKGDLLARHSDGTFDVLLSSGSTLAYNTNFTSYFSDSSGFNTGNRFMARDVNGDGKTDLIMRYANGSFEEWFSNGTTLYSAYVYTSTLTDTAGWNTGFRFF
jgi:hypothetical protein